MFRNDQIGTVLPVCLPKEFGFPKSDGKNAVKPDLSSPTLCESEPRAESPPKNCVTATVTDKQRQQIFHVPKKNSQGPKQGAEMTEFIKCCRLVPKLTNLHEPIIQQRPFMYVYPSKVWRYGVKIA